MGCTYSFLDTVVVYLLVKKDFLWWLCVLYGHKVASMPFVNINIFVVCDVGYYFYYVGNRAAIAE